MTESVILCVTIQINVMCECMSGLFNAPISGMPHLAYLAWGRCWRNKVYMQLESSPRGQYCLDCPNPLKWCTSAHGLTV